MLKRCRIAAVILVIAIAGVSAHAEDDPAKPEDEQKVQWDMVSDTVMTTLNKANALIQLKRKLKMTLEKPNTGEQYAINAIGQKVPTRTALKSATSLHNEEPL